MFRFNRFINSIKNITKKIIPNNAININRYIPNNPKIDIKYKNFIKKNIPNNATITNIITEKYKPNNSQKTNQKKYKDKIIIQISPPKKSFFNFILKVILIILISYTVVYIILILLCILF